MPHTLLPLLVAAPNHRTPHAPNHYFDTLQGSKETTILLHNLQLVAMATKRTRTDLTLAEKLKAIRMVDGKRSQTDVATQLGVSQSQVSRILKNRNGIAEKWRSYGNLERRRQRSGKDADVEAALRTWLTKSVGGGDVPPPSGRRICEKAKDLAARLNKPDFKPTVGWLCRWKERNAVVCRRIRRNNKDALPELLETDESDDPLVCDETRGGLS